MLKKRVGLSVVALMGATVSSMAETGTLLLDFYGSQNGGYFAASASDFQAQDAAVDLGATVNAIEGSTAGPIAVTGTLGLSATVTITAEEGFSQDATGDRNNVPILDGYLRTTGTSTTITIDGFEEIQAGTDVLVTLYAIGESSSEFSTPNARYDSVNFNINFPATSTTGSVGTIGPNAYTTFTFTKVDGVDTLDIRTSRNSQYSIINGVSLTYVPEPSALALFAIAGLAVTARRRRVV